MKKEKIPSNETHQILNFNLKNKWCPGADSFGFHIC